MIALIGCGKKKSSQTCYAQDMYQGLLFKTKRMYCESRGIPFYIISAKYGLLRPRQVISPYDTTLKRFTPEHRIEWGKKVVSQMEAQGIRRGSRILALAGKEYLEYIRTQYEVVNPLKNLGLFKQVSFLQELIKGKKT